MYEEFYSLDRRPFTTSPDPDFLFWTDGHVMAFTMMRYGLMTRAQITVLTGEIGSGKTTLVRQLLREIPGDAEIGLISNMQADRGELLHWALMALGHPIENEPYVHLFQRFQNHLVKAYAAGRRVVLVFDEAQNLGVSALEELRMLSNINSENDDILQLILVGQPQLRALLARPELVQFSQRIVSDFHLESLNATEVESYIHHRIMVSGGKWRIFPQATCVLIHEATRGVPRLINVLCDICLVYGYAADTKVIDESLLREFLVGARARGIYEQFFPIGGSTPLVRQVS